MISIKIFFDRLDEKLTDKTIIVQAIQNDVPDLAVDKGRWTSAILPLLNKLNSNQKNNKVILAECLFTPDLLLQGHLETINWINSRGFYIGLSIIPHGLKL